MSSQDTLLGGRYRLETVIGRGGMAEVWRARDERLGRPVAVKRLRVDLASDPTFLARFRREAQSAAGLNHPNIVSVYDTGEALDTVSQLEVPYIVMELVQGHTLRDVLRDGRKILPERALQFVQGALDALTYSHKHGIVHRDIKPANVMLTPGGQVKVMDFGIARAVADTSATMTQTAAVIGTAQYLSPEQARGETVDHRSDIYSAGCLLYELLVGRPPFVGDSPVSVAYQHVREAPVPPSHLDPEITPAMDAITLKALAKDPADRYQDASEMSEDISRLLAGQAVTAVVPAPLTVVADAAPTAIVPGMVADPPTGSFTGVTSVVTDDDLPDEPRKRSAMTYVLVGLAALLLVALGFGLYQVLKPDPRPQQVAVPLLKGWQEDAAKSQIVNSQLQVGKVTYVNGDDQDKGKVIDQSPAGQQKVDVNTPVNITVNIGVKTAKVPDGLVGKPEAEVKAALEKAGFTVKREDATIDEGLKYKKGIVAVVSPSSGADYPTGKQVLMKVATGMVTVPDGLVGQSEEDATKALTDAGFKVKTEEADGAQGQVVAVTPESGQAVEKGTEVTLSIGRGDPKIPDGLVGKSKEDATKALQDAGFKVKAVDATQPEPVDAQANQVIEVNPSGGNYPKGTEVTITVATGQSVVPNLRGKTLADAEAKAKELGFSLEVVEEENTAQPGTVFNQDPNDGELRDRGTTIKVWIAKGPGEGESSSGS